MVTGGRAREGVIVVIVVMIRAVTIVVPVVLTVIAGLAAIVVMEIFVVVTVATIFCVSNVGQVLGLTLCLCLFKFSPQPHEAATLITSILQIKELRYKKVEPLTQSRSAGK